MPNLSQITIAGHLGRDAETKQVGSTTVCEFNMAVNAKQKGEDTTMWFRCAVWGKRGESVAQYLTKGKAVLVSGRFSVRDYEGKNGPGYALEVNADALEFLGGGEQLSWPGQRNDAPDDDSSIPF